MREKFGKSILEALAVIIGIILCVFLFNFISAKRVDNQYKKMLIDKYGFSEVKTITFKNKHKIKEDEWHFTALAKNNKVQAFGRYQCDDRVVTVFDGYDDYYYDDLVAEVKNYYKNMFQTDKVYVNLENFTGAHFLDEDNMHYMSTDIFGDYMYWDLAKNPLDAVNEDVVHDIIDFARNVYVVMQKNADESDEEAIGRVQKLLDAKTYDVKTYVILMSDISEVEEGRKRTNENEDQFGYFFDKYYIDITNKDKIIKVLESGN
ncbi:MAG: hypothetical protein MJ113_03195 [Lachnospiraceae bacterium]|nr:hypothetical protein [Lachnospiraceae bacterium]